MATVWLNSTATSSISFNTISIWSTWDDATDSEVPLGRLPQSGDYIYANGYTCLIPTGTLNLGTAILSNGDNHYTGRNGGSFFYSVVGTYNITANLEHYGYSTLLGTSSVGNANRQTTIQGNITSYTTNGTCAVSAGGSTGLTTINGNLIGAFCVQSAWGASRVTVNGNVDVDDGNPAVLIYQLGGGTPTETITINGNAKNEFVRWIGTAGSANIYVYGTYTHDSAVSFNKSVSNFIFGTLINTGSVLTCTSVTIYSSLIYKGYNNYIGIRYQNLYTPNPDTFTCKDIAEPRSNPFIILTDAEMNNRQQYPSENEVKQGVEYVWGEKVGTYQQPPESVVLKGYRYDNDTKEGTLENQNIVGCVTPEDVRKDVPLVGMGVVGSLVVPSVDDVREGVIFDNGSVGTLIVQGGGDRLRIADFSYYTNAQSDTYIVDLTEQDKPKFAVAEERVLIEMFPDLDLDNIPDKYFDDLFVKYLKYRLIVEYYRTAGINSTFTPSEPTTEIVNYQNVRNEVWLNSANIYLKAWAKKYPESIAKPQRILL